MLFCALILFLKPVYHRHPYSSATPQAQGLEPFEKKNQWLLKWMLVPLKGGI